jgi:tRNA (adenine37-N6)-methyltransferase
MEITPIGYVSNPANKKIEWETLISEIEILPEYEEGLFRIETLSEIYVIYQFDRSREILLRVHPFHDLSLPEVGVFASRSPTRPNHLGMKRVKLLARRGNVLVVKGLDALNGTPVIDIKPVVTGEWPYKSEK